MKHKFLVIISALAHLQQLGRLLHTVSVWRVQTDAAAED